MKTRSSETTYRIFIGVITGMVSFLALYPIYYIVTLSFTSEAEWVAKGGLVLWVNDPTLAAYRYILGSNSFVLNSFVISVARTAVGTSFGLVVTCATGYALSRRQMPGRTFLTLFVIITILFNGGLIPTYLVVQGTGLLNTFWVYIIPLAVYSWGVLVFKQFFENVPYEIEESAIIDGASEIALMTRIIVPMSKPVVAAIGLFLAVIQWNNWFDALIYIRNFRLYPLQLVLRNLFSVGSMAADTQGSRPDPTLVRVPEISLKMAVAVIGTVPILMVYPFLQKYFIKGVYTGSVKG